MLGIREYLYSATRVLIICLISYIMESTIPILGADAGLGAAMSPPSTLSQTRVRQRTVRSCQICHQRKVRCDKKLPCSNCVRGKGLCRYPDPERKVRRPHKTTITDVAARLSQLEGVIRTAPSNPDSNQHASQPREASAEISSHGEIAMSQDGDTGTNRNASAEDLLVEDGGSSCYVNEVLLSRILDEVSIPEPFPHWTLRKNSIGERTAVGNGNPQG